MQTTEIDATPRLLFDVPAAARELSIGTTYLRRMVSSGELRAVRLGRRLLIPRAELERLARVESPAD